MLNKIKLCIKDYHTIINPANKTVGSIIKHRRKEMGLTLEEVSKDVCSLSYLCKVERNQLIPNDSILNTLKERLKIDNRLFVEEENDYLWIEDILSKKYVESNILNNHIDKVDYRSKLIMLAYNVFNEKNYEKSSLIANELIGYYNFFLQDELIFFVVLVIQIYYGLEKYNHIIELSRELVLFNVKNNIEHYTNILVIKSYYKIGLYNNARSLLEKTKSISYKYANLDEITNLINYELSHLASISCSDQIKNELNILNNLGNINEDYIWFSHYFFNKHDYEKSLVYISKLKNKNEFFYIRYLVTLFKLSMHNELKKEIIKNSELLYKKSSKIIILFFNYYFNNSSNTDLDSSFRELSNVDVFVDDYFIQLFVLEELVKLSNKKSLYKQSVRLMTKIIKLLKRKASIICE